MPKAPYSHVEDLFQVFKQLKIDKAVIMGISAGGALTIDFTLKYPEKVKTLVLVGAVVSGYNFSPFVYSRGGRINLSEIKDNREKMIQYFGWDDPYEIYKENIDAKKRMLQLLKKYPDNVDYTNRGKYEKPLDREALGHLNEIKVPMPILTGEYDIPDVHANAGVIETNIKNSKRVIVMKSPHLIPLEQPDVFNKLCAEFLNGLN